MCPYPTCALSTPRISFGLLKTVICACPVAPRLDPAVCTAPVGRGGVYPGWCGRGGYLGGLYRVLPTHPVHWYCQGPTSTKYRYIPAQDVRGPLQASLRPSAHPAPRIPASGPIRARFHLKYTKVSPNLGVSPKSRHEAWHTPYLKTGSESHDLEFLRFPICRAFSPKE